MDRYRVHFTYRGGRFDGRKGKRTIKANDKEEAGSRVSNALNSWGGYPGRYIAIDYIEQLSKESK